MDHFRIIFIHGYSASAKADWYPSISQKLDALYIDYSIPNLPGGNNPHAQEWIETIHGVVTQSKKPVILVGHSLGTRAILLYLEKYPQKIEKVFLIAAFANKIENAKRHNGETYPDFFTHTIQLEKIKKVVGQCIVVHSLDDSSIPYIQAVELAKELDAKLITEDKRDHFSDPENASYIFELLKKEIRF